MRVFKFGGASVKDAAGVKNVAKVLDHFKGEKIFIVISAMGKMTNHLETIIDADSKEEIIRLLDEFEEYHVSIAKELGIENEIVQELIQSKNQIILAKENIHNPLELYDSIICHGELTSTKLVTAYLKHIALDTIWIDAREFILTSSLHKSANVIWQASQAKISALNKRIKEPTYAITQGFIGSCSISGKTTSLGREGSDYSAAIFAYLLDATSVTIWKDVPGMLNADPRFFTETIKLSTISYREAIELAYYGASVIHPKTVKPLQNKGIPLYVKSFLSPQEEGTLIGSGERTNPLVPSYIFKPKQILVSITPKDYSFIAENHLSHIFQTFTELGLTINLMQNSALNFSVVLDQHKTNIKNLTQKLQNQFMVKFNTDLELLTIRHFDDHTIKQLTSGKNIYLQQSSRTTLRLVLS